MVLVLEAQKALLPPQSENRTQCCTATALFSTKSALGSSLQCFIGFMVLTYCDIPQQLKHR